MPSVIQAFRSGNALETSFQGHYHRTERLTEASASWEDLRRYPLNTGNIIDGLGDRAFLDSSGYGNGEQNNKKALFAFHISIPICP